ncbi:MAG: TonB-dependent receptor, partial [Betaproteobacteria bacterium]
LKRLPGITISGAPGRGGDIRMRGLGRGYTLILLNGEPMPRGFSLDTLSPEQVEKIEILRAPVAENSARAIAGTINIVLREELVKRDNQLIATLGTRAGRIQPSVSIQRNDVIDKFSYNVTATAGHADVPSESRTETRAVDTTTGVPVLVQDQQDRATSKSDNVHLNARLNWKLDGGDNFVLTPFLVSARSSTASTSTLEQPLGALPPPYATSQAQSHSEINIGRVFGNWKLRLPDNAKLELRLNGGTSASEVESDTQQNAASGSLAHRLHKSATIHDRSFGTSGKYSRPLAQAHQFGAGWEIEEGRRDERSSDVLDSVDPLAQYGDIEARTQRAALYVQDEWDITPLWAMYGGLRWETIRTGSTSAIDSVSNRSSVLSPLFHTVWRFDPQSKDQVRLAVTRTYRSPTLSNLVAVPSLSQSYPVSGPNTPTSADSVGNPHLKPELAWGVDIAIEHYFEAGGLLSASVFRRSIDDLIRNVTALETVPWSPVQRWVSRPRNIGHATSQGIELEAKIRLDELFEDAPRVNLRANYSRYWSRVDDVPGPNNRLDQQPPWTANFGGDYRMTSLPLSFGGNLNLTPSFVVEQARGQEYSQGLKRSADVYALWRFNAATQFRLSAANLYGADYSTATREVFATTDQTATTTARTYRYYGARLEQKF